jgi:cytochrome b6-f complex iron-sulfur subunit
MVRCTRREFQLMLAGCAAGMLRCSSPPTLTPMNNKVTLTFAQFPSLMSPNNGVVVSVENGFPIAVVRTGDTTATALSATCTHQACLVQYEPDSMQLHCPCHDANFTLQGAVVHGPTIIPLPVYAATVASDSIVVDLS